MINLQSLSDLGFEQFNGVYIYTLPNGLFTYSEGVCTYEITFKGILRAKMEESDLTLGDALVLFFPGFIQREMAERLREME